MYHIHFGFASWGLTYHQLSQQGDNGGYELQLPETWSQTQGALAIVQFFSQPLRFPCSVRACFEHPQTFNKGLLLQPSLFELLQVPLPYITLEYKCQRAQINV